MRTNNDSAMDGEKITWDDFKEMFINDPSNVSKEGQLVLFRGQGNFHDPLQTTLSRYTQNIGSFDSDIYHKKMLSIAREIPALTDILNKIPENFIFRSDFMYPHEDYQEQAYATFFVMAYLRHHGIPSPLLDWTRNPLVAAFFALQNVMQNNDAAIFVLRSTNKLHHAKNPTLPQLFVIDHSNYINEKFNEFPEGERILNRHHAQKGAYTICFSNQKDLSKITYQMMNHDHYFMSPDSKEDSYYLKKYVISAVQRRYILDELFNKKNINNTSLYAEFSPPDLALKYLYF